ncbi:cation-transporting P-type ATPase, partial [Candidatus Parcubacteria bacterium]|nr:cation-transporting P-type ATPase [Candidatus Parcubacteria bacterium]
AADARIIASYGFETDESTLTGESRSGVKSAAAATVPFLHSPNMVWAGTLALEGQAEAVVVRTGLETELGQIVTLLRETRQVATPLQRRLRDLSILIGVGIIVFAAAVVLIGFGTGHLFADVFVASLSLVVSAVPEGLLPLITAVLALGMRRVLRVRGLVRNLAATETLGAITVICTDKTGTLTEGQMQVSHILTSTRELLHRPPFDQLDHNGIESHIVALKIAVLASDAFIENPESALGQWVVRGGATERALVLAGMHSGLKRHELESAYPRLEHLPFASSRGFSATLRKAPTGYWFAAMGTPERLIAEAKHVYADGREEGMTEELRATLRQDMRDLAAKGLRVLACASKTFARKPRYRHLEDLLSEVTFVGFIGLTDPIRPDAKTAIARARRAGIRPIMVTGDHPETALAVATEVGLVAPGAEAAVLGETLEAMAANELAAVVESRHVFARVTPKMKVRIVEALQQAGAVVAMTGDGVNDAPALRRADVGLALGSGTEVAKEAADIVLLDDNFKIITDAIEEGRTLFGTIRKIIVHLLADDFSELLLFLGAMALYLPLPLLPAQILWINVIEDGFPGTALAFEGKEHEVMHDPPRDPQEAILNKPFRKFLGAVAIITGIAAFGTFTLLWAKLGDLDRVRTIVFALMAVDSLIFAFVVRAIRKPIVRADILSNKLLVAAGIFGIALLLLAVYLPALQQVLATVPISLFDWGVILIVSLVELAFLEIAKQRCFGRVRAA